jgi:hypothetical protein
VWEKGNISIVQLEEKLRAAARQALADAIMELRLLPASLCTEDIPPGMPIKNLAPGSSESQQSRQEPVLGKGARMRFVDRSRVPHQKYSSSCPSPSPAHTPEEGLALELISQTCAAVHGQVSYTH